jgi:3-dehydroquinate synthase
LEVQGGEASKSLENAEKLWLDLMAEGADRSSLLINLGGGVVSDLGGFVAAGYNRGIKYINIPTSLMGQADAAIGGKTAVNLGNIKNQVGFFHSAAAIFICPDFLMTLPEEHLRSGFAEIIKSILVSDGSLWRRLKNRPVSRMLRQPVESAFWQELILAAITFKNKVVVKDYREVKLRKVLNFGHSFGHAFESFSMMDSQVPLLHGEAVAAGMICAAWLSHRKTGLSRPALDEITNYIVEGFGRYHVGPVSLPILMEIMKHDKKMKDGKLQFTLLSKPGLPLLNVSCSQEEILEAIDFYNTTLTGCRTLSG